MKYKSDITEAQYRLVNNNMLFVKSKRPRKYKEYEIFNAIMYVIVTGIQWRQLPNDYPCWRSVFYYYSKWRKSEVLDYLLEEVNVLARKKHLGYHKAKIGIVDSQSTDNSDLPQEKGYDGHKKVNGVKRFLITDELGLVCGIRVAPANLAEVKGAKELIVINKRFKRHNYSIHSIYADKGFVSKRLISDVGKLNISFRAMQKLGCIKNKSDNPMVINITNNRLSIAQYLNKLISKDRWKVERTFAWFGKYRRLSKNYERTLESSEAMIKLVGIKIAFGKLGD